MTRLKSLELQGYKTFASKALFEFPGNTTAIVGPNGSGKSNIADAIRWVLGEQAYSVLRGKKTEDMIFAGSEFRPRSGMALASITFNNEDGWLPIDFNEVVISRRAYRDGDNEYMLNNQRVRLKEINELLSQTGLAERTYTIIGQGLVDAALSLKPDERRKFFEEAAGIGLYRSRRDESINRLEATKRNLERVHDIISELGPRVNSLERQARKVQEYERIRSDLRMMLRDWYGFQWNKQNNELIQAGIILREREKNLEKARDATQQEEENYKGFHDQMQVLREKLIDLNQQLSERHQEREVKTRELAVMEERILGLQARSHDLEVQIATVSEEIDSNKKSIDLFNNEIIMTSQEVTELMQERDITQTNLDLRKKEREAIEEKIKDLDKARILLNSKKIEQDIRFEHLQQDMKEIKETILNYQNQVEDHSKSTETISASIHQLVDRISNLQDNFAKSNNELLGFEQSLILNETALNEYKLQRVNKNSELDSLNQRKIFFENAKFQMIGTSEGAKKLLEISQSKKLKGIKGLLHQLLRVPRQLEKAVNSVLGDAIDTVILSEEVQISEIKGLLAQITKQKTFIYRGFSKKDITSKAADGGDSGYIRLLDRISFPEEIQTLLHSLLDKYYFIDNEDTVFDVINQLPKGTACVTEAGNIYFDNGLIIISGDCLQSGLTFSREISEAQIEIENTEKILSNLQEQIASRQNSVNQIKETINGINDNSSKISSELKDLENSLASAKSQHEQLLEKKKWNSEQIAILEDKLFKNNSEHDSISDSLVKINNDEKKLESEIYISRQQLEKLPTLEITATLNEKQQNFIKVNQKSQILNTQLQERQNQIKNLEQKAATVIDQKTAADQEIHQIEDNKKKVMDSVSNIKNQINEFHTASAPLEKNIAEREIENQSYINNLGSARQSLTVAERFHAQVQLEHSRQKDKLDNLRGKIEDDFGLVAFTYAEEIEGPSPLPFEGLVEQLPNLTLIPENLEESILRQRGILRRIGPINQEADREYKESKQRLDFLNEQVADLNKADVDLRKVINELDVLIRSEFKKTFDAVALEFHAIFSQLFVGGSARLTLAESEDPNEMGVDIEAKLPGRREQGLSLLSGGERSLTATALIFALLRVSPTPFCVLDEVDAMLDESNVGRFCDLLKELSQKTQFIVITHNRNTVQVADVIYGVTMGRDSASQVIGLKMDEINEEMVK